MNDEEQIFWYRTVLRTWYGSVTCIMLMNSCNVQYGSALEEDSEMMMYGPSKIRRCTTTMNAISLHLLAFVLLINYSHVVVVVVESFNALNLPQPKGLSRQKLLDLANKRYNTKNMNDNDCPMKDRVVVITGAAGGIGNELCQIVHSLGATVLALDRNRKGLDQLQQQLQEEKRLWTFPIQQEDLTSVSMVANDIQQQFPNIDVLVNNAGLTYNDPSTIDTTKTGPTSTHGKDLAFTVNYLSHVLLTEKLLPNLMQPNNNHDSNHGRVVHITSTYHWKVDGTELIPSVSCGGDNEWLEPMAYQSDPKLQSYKHYQRSYANTKLAQLWHSRAIPCSSVCACPTWAATSIAGNEGSAKDFLNQYAFPVSNLGPGITSSINAILRTDQELGDALHNNNNNNHSKCFVANSRILEYIWGFDTWLTSNFITNVLGIRDEITDLCSGILLLGQRYTYDDFIIQKTSPESFMDHDQIQKFYEWSKKEIQPYM